MSASFGIQTGNFAALYRPRHGETVSKLTRVVETMTSGGQRYSYFVTKLHNKLLFAVTSNVLVTF